MCLTVELHSSVFGYLWRNRIAVCDSLTLQDILETAQKNIDSFLHGGIMVYPRVASARDSTLRLASRPGASVS